MIPQLTPDLLTGLNGSVHSKPEPQLLQLPEKVLQFGTGVLLRGLPDYYIDKANKQGIFNGRIVIVKSTAGGDSTAFEQQQGLYTQCIRGVKQGQVIDEVVINASVSRVLAAKTQWKQVLECAANPHLEVVISNTTEVGIVLMKDDRIDAEPPVSFPGKLLAFLYRRYQLFNGDISKGLVIVPTELITDNGTKLQSVLFELAHINKLDYGFLDWLENANQFCSSLVDRIVPGALPPAQQQQMEQKLGFQDALMIMSEVYGLWAIQSAHPRVNEVLSFAAAESGVVITEDITRFRELKLRLLNGTHTFSCGLAHLAGFELVKHAMEDATFGRFVADLMKYEIAPCLVGDMLSEQDTVAFADMVTDRFRNPFLEHKWLSITLNYTHKMRMRNVPLLLEHYKRNLYVPDDMALGFAAYILFMKSYAGEDGKYYGQLNGQAYHIQDDCAAQLHRHWEASNEYAVAKAVLADKTLWEENLGDLPGFAYGVGDFMRQINDSGVLQVILDNQARRRKLQDYETQGS